MQLWSSAASEPSCSQNNHKETAIKKNFEIKVLALYQSNYRRNTQPVASPSGQSSSAVLLYGDCGPADPDVSNPCHPSSDPALDDHGGTTQPLSS